MHKDVSVAERASKWLGESLADPMTNGTQYASLAKEMIKGIASQARALVKYVPK